MAISEPCALSIGGVNVRFQAEDPEHRIEYPSAHQRFLNRSHPDITITVKAGLPPAFNFGQPEFTVENWTYYRAESFTAFRLHKPGSPEQVDHYTIIMNTAGTEADLYFEDLPARPEKPVRFEVPPPSLDEILAVELLSKNRGVMFHASGLQTASGHGLLMAGTSGSGKSTTARLWEASGKAALLGDERISVQKQDGRFNLQGTAWHGSGKAATLGVAPISHIFILFHADSNQARALTPAEAVSLLMARAFLPYWDRDGLNFTLKFLADLCQAVPCFHLGFRPDQSAVEYVECLISS